MLALFKTEKVFGLFYLFCWFFYIFKYLPNHNNYT